jgi:hypothetical protein
MFKKTSVDGAIKSLTKALNDLEYVIQIKRAEADQYEELARLANIETDRAGRIWSKLKEILS